MPVWISGALRETGGGGVRGDGTGGTWVRDIKQRSTIITGESWGWGWMMTALTPPCGAQGLPSPSAPHPPDDVLTPALYLTALTLDGEATEMQAP